MATPMALSTPDPSKYTLVSARIFPTSSTDLALLAGMQIGTHGNHFGPSLVGFMSLNSPSLMLNMCRVSIIGTLCPSMYLVDNFLICMVSGCDWGKVTNLIAVLCMLYSTRRWKGGKSTHASMTSMGEDLSMPVI